MRFPEFAQIPQSSCIKAVEELAALDRMETACREKRAEGKNAPDAIEPSLRTTIGDPRYWHDGDPSLARFVSGGFKRHYPGNSGE